MKPVLALCLVALCASSGKCQEDEDTALAPAPAPAPNSFSCPCPTYVIPICISNGETFNNYCELDCLNAERALQNLPPMYAVHEGTCVDVKCNCNPNVYSPVCGRSTNFATTTYYNYCYLDCASRQSVQDGKGKIVLKNIGRCKNDPNCICPLIKSPVCASNGQTFGNPCMLDCENRKRWANNDPLLTQVYKGPCIYCPCKNIFVPVCGTDNKTYKNECELNCEILKRQKLNLPPIKLWYKGACKSPIKKCEDQCVNLPFMPMCGTDGKNYSNICYLNCASFKSLQQGNLAIFIDYFGYC